MNRVPLWVDLRHVPDPAPFRAAADAAACEAMLGVDHDVDGDTVLHDGRPVARFMTLAGAADQEAAARAEGRILVEGTDWTIIPLENLIAARRDRPDTLYAVADTPEQAGVFRDTLEVGVHGVVLRPNAPEDIHEADRVLRAKGPRPDDRFDGPAHDLLVPATVTAVEDAGPGDRVCIDATSMFHDGEGLLVGSTARGFALIHAETLTSEYVNPRPFRVNAGAVHAYLYGPDGRTQYLSEVRSGDRVLAVAADGTTRTCTVGRAKIERRPHTLVRWTGELDGHVVVQTAETIRFVRPDGTPVAVTDLAPGDKILVHTEHAARHFGMPVDEHLEER